MGQEIKTLRIGDRLVVLDGENPLAYVDLTKVNKGDKTKAVVRFEETN